MINKETEFFAVDNSGASIVKVIASMKKALKNIEVGDFVLVSIKSLRKKRRKYSKVKKGNVYVGLVAGLSKEKRKITKSKKIANKTYAVLSLSGTSIFFSEKPDSASLFLAKLSKKTS